MNDLSKKRCKPCEGSVFPLSKETVEDLKESIDNGWSIELDGEEGERFGKNRLLRREFKFDDFKRAMDFVGNVAVLAEAEGHHPNIHIFYNKVVLELTTHAVEGLSENDFIMAAKVDKI